MKYLQGFSFCALLFILTFGLYGCGEGGIQGEFEIDGEELGLPGIDIDIKGGTPTIDSHVPLQGRWVSDDCTVGEPFPLTGPASIEKIPDGAKWLIVEPIPEDGDTGSAIGPEPAQVFFPKKYWAVRVDKINLSAISIEASSVEDAIDELLASTHGDPLTKKATMIANVQIIASDVSDNLWEVLISQEEEIADFMIEYNGNVVADTSSPNFSISYGDEGGRVEGAFVQKVPFLGEGGFFGNLEAVPAYKTHEVKVSWMGIDSKLKELNFALKPY